MRRVKAPLFARVTPEKLLVQLSSDLIDHHILGSPDHLHRLGTFGQEHLGLLLVHLQAIQRIQRIQVDGYRYQFAVDPRQNPVLVTVPFGELRQVVDNAFGVGMKDVRPVAMHQHARAVEMVVCVACDMGTTINQQHALAEPRGQSFSQHAAGKTGTDNQKIVGLCSIDG